MPRPTDLSKPLLILFLLSLIVRGLTALPQHGPGNLDEAYHTVNAITLATGGGFAEGFIWNYLNPPADVTHPGNLYWLPLTGIIAAAGMLIGGTSYSAGQGGFVLLSALLPLLGYLIAWQVSGVKRHAWIVALLMLFSGFYFPVWTVIDTFTPFALAGALSLYAAWRMLETDRYRWALLAGAMAGLAHLTRADGLLLPATIGLALVVRGTWYVVRDNKTSTRHAPRTTGFSKPFALLLTLLIAYLIVMLPWFIRNIQVAGTPLPSGGSKTMWLQSYNDIFSYDADLSRQSYLAWGWENIIRSKLWAAWVNLQTAFAVLGLIVALPLVVIGGWKQRRHLLFQIVFLYALFLWAAMTLVFTFPGPRGALFHSGGAIVPFLFSAAMIGLDTAIAWLARKRPAWRGQAPKNIFSGAMVFFALLISLFVYTQRAQSGQEQIQTAYAQIAQRLAGQEATVMIGNPPGYLYQGGYQAIMIPTEDIEGALQVADRYGAAYLALDSNFTEHPLSPYLSEQAAHPRLRLETTFAGPTYLYRIVNDTSDETQAD